MKLKISIIYSWFVRTLTYFLPNIPFIMRFRGFLYSLMMAECGKDFQVASSVIINSLSGLKVGKHVYVGPNTIILATELTIEDTVLIGPANLIASGNHTLENGSFRYGSPSRNKIIIKKGAWISGNCSILSGAVMPESSVLAAGSVLNKEFQEKYGLYAGSPACFIKKLI